MTDTVEARQQAIRAIMGGGILATDYDGCLSPLHDVAERAWRARGVLPALQELGAAPGVLTLVISGRPRRLTEDGKRGIEDFLRTDNVHDRDLATGSNRVGTEAPVGRFDIDGMGYTLGDAFPDIPITDAVDLDRPERIYLESKPEGIAVHTRTIAATRPEEAERVLTVAEQFYLNRGEEWEHPPHTTPGSNVLDIQVRPASKGRPIIYLRQKFPDRPITYVGDDITDIAAMLQLAEGDTAVVVGDRITQQLNEKGIAEGVNVLHLAEPAELAEFLTAAAAATAARSQ